jgi:hypothetical protein
MKPPCPRVAGRAALCWLLVLTSTTALHAQGGAPAPAAPQDISAGLDVLREVHRRYSTTRFRTLTFTQRTTHPDGRVEWWYEAESIPGKARVDASPFANRNAQIYRSDSAYVFRNGELAQRSAMLAATMWTLMDMYAIPPEETAAALGRRGFDLSKVHEREHNGRAVLVVGALQGDTTSAQFWLDKEHMYTVRMTTTRGGKRVTEIGRHVFMGGGWVEQEIRAYGTNGQLTLLEEYLDVKVNLDLPANLFEPDMYRTPPWQETRPPGK